jgi:urease accessory protein
MAADGDAPHRSFEGYAAESVPQAAVGAPGKDGRLELRFRAAAGGTRLVHDYATAPFHVSGTLDHDPHPDAETVFVQSPTGGVAQGDRLTRHVDVGGDAVAHVSAGSATKVQSMTRNYAASEASLAVASGGHLDHVPEPTILHADARYHRETTLDVAHDATCVLGEVVVPGRLARGERFAFERFRSHTRVRGPDGLLFADATHLAPGADGPSPDEPGVLGEFAVLGTLLVVAPARDAAALADACHEAATGGPSRAGATRLPNDAGVLVRALGDRAEDVETSLAAAWDRARRTLVDAPAPTGRRH